MFSDDVLRILSYFDQPVRLKKIIAVIEISKMNCVYSSKDSFRVSVIHALKHLSVEGFIIAENRTYRITALGLKHLAKYELDNEIYQAILERVM